MCESHTELFIIYFRLKLQEECNIGVGGLQRDEITGYKHKCKFLQNKDGEVIWHRVNNYTNDDIVLHHRENAVYCVTLESDVLSVCSD